MNPFPPAQRMHTRTRGAAVSSIVAAVMLALSLGAAGCKPEPVPDPPPPATAATTQPASSLATEPATQPAAATYFDVLRDLYPALPATQPLAVPVSLPEAAHLVLTQPVHLDEQGHLWITDPDGVDAEAAIKTAGDSPDNEHVVRERVLLAWWLPDRAGGFAPRIVAPSAAGTAELIVPSRRLSMGERDDYRWDRARSWVDGEHQRLIVPTRQGISVFTFESDREPVVESHQDLTDIGGLSATAPVAGPTTRASTTAPATRPAAATGRLAPTEEPQFLFDPRGFIAWIPATPQEPGSPGAARFLDNRWIALTPAAGWPDRILHLLPLRDGSVTQLLFKSAEEGGGVTVALAAVDAPAVDKKEILDLVDQLSEADNDLRNAAYGRLTEYGPGIWPILREIDPENLGPEARIRLNRLLKSQVTPMLGGMALQGDQLKLVERLRDGGAVFYTDQGINLPDPLAVEPVSYAPAWIAARPGRPVEMLTGALIFSADPERTKFDVVQGQWVVTMDDAGPQQFLGNSFRPLVRKEGRAFNKVVGIDRRGRWVLRKPTADGVPPDDAETLIVDTTLPDFTPRLPVWLYANADEAGWDQEGWPAVRLGDLRVKLAVDRWASLREEDQIFVDPPEASEPSGPPSRDSTAPADPPAPADDAATAPAGPPATAQATSPATSPATAPAMQGALSDGSLADLGPPLLADPAGDRYFGGIRDLIRVSADGRRVRWRLPDDAVGDDETPPTLILAGDGRLFLFNSLGRVLRIKPTPDAAEPFLLEATFTKNIPAEPATRIWLDPAGRIIMAYDRRLAILFPQGFIPRPIRLMMDVDDEEEE